MPPGRVVTVVRRRQAQVRGGLQDAIRTAEDRDRKLKKLATGMTVRGLGKRGSGNPY